MNNFAKRVTVPGYIDGNSINVVNVLAIGALINLPLNITSFINQGFSSILTFFSSKDLSGIGFTIKGYYAGNLITEFVYGPNKSSVNSLNFYDEIISITPNTSQLVDLIIGAGAICLVSLNSHKASISKFARSLRFNVLISNVLLTTVPKIAIASVNADTPFYLFNTSMFNDDNQRPNNLQVLVNNITQEEINNTYVVKDIVNTTTLVVVLYAIPTPTYVVLSEISYN